MKETVDATLNRISSSGVSGASYFTGSIIGTTRYVLFIHTVVVYYIFIIFVSTFRVFPITDARSFRETLSLAASSERMVKWAAGVVLLAVDSVAPSLSLGAIKSYYVVSDS